MGDHELVEKMRRYQQTIQELKSLESWHQQNYQDAMSDSAWGGYGSGVSKLVHGLSDGTMSVLKALPGGSQLVSFLYDGAHVAIDQTYNNPSAATTADHAAMVLDYADKYSNAGKGTGFGSLLKTGTAGGKIIEKAVNGGLGDDLAADAKTVLSGSGSAFTFIGNGIAGKAVGAAGGVAKGLSEMYDGATTLAGVSDERERIANRFASVQSDLQNTLLEMERRRADLVREAQAQGVSIPDDVLAPGATLGLRPEEVGYIAPGPPVVSSESAGDADGDGGGAGYAGKSAAESAAEAAEHARRALDSEQEARRAAEQAGQHEQEAAQHAVMAALRAEESAQRAEAARQHEEQASRHAQAAAQQAHEANQLSQNAGRHEQEAGQHAQAAGQQAEEAGQHAQMSAQHAQEAGQHAQAAGQQEQAAAQHAETAAQHEQRAGQHTQTAGQHEREAAQALETTRDQEATAQRAHDETTKLHDEAARLREEIADLHHTASELERSVDELRARAQELATHVESAARECDLYRAQAVSQAQVASTAADESAAAAARAQSYAGD